MSTVPASGGGTVALRGARRIPVLDVALAGLGLLMTALEASLLVEYGRWPYLVATLVSAGLSVALLLRRRHVVGSAVATYLLLAVMAVNALVSPVGLGLSPLLVCAPLTVVALTRYGRSRRWGLVAAGVAVLGVPLSPAIQFIGFGRPDPTAYLTSVLSMAAVHVLVIAVAYLWALRQREVADRHRAELDEVRSEIAAREQIAAAHERNRIAREVHDVVAHSVALIQVEAATGLAIAGTEPEHALRSLETIKKASRDALAETRYLVGVLREPGADADRSPAAGLVDLPGLLDRVRDGRVDLRAELPEPDVLSDRDAAAEPASRLAAVRVVQEAVTNAVRHGRPGAPVHVTVTFSDSDLRIRARNRLPDVPGTTSGPGFGLLGLVERLDTVGGRIEHGCVDGEFTVDARIPWPSAVEAAQEPAAGARRR